jgi:hypothetical protein
MLKKTEDYFLEMQNFDTFASRFGRRGARRKVREIEILQRKNTDRKRRLKIFKFIFKKVCKFKKHFYLCSPKQNGEFYNGC